MEEYYEGITPKFGDEKTINFLKRNRIKKLESTKVTIDLRRLMKVGLEKEQALNLIERLIKK